MEQRISSQNRKWKRIMTVYFILCLVFIVIILYQHGQGMEERAFDCLAVLAGAVFFMIQATVCRKEADRRERATVRTTATFLRQESSMGIGSDRSKHYSIFEFYAAGAMHEIRSNRIQELNKGDQVDLYYAPSRPDIFYIPEAEKTKSRIVPAILFLYGIIFPVTGLLAPLFR